MKNKTENDYKGVNKLLLKLIWRSTPFVLEFAVDRVLIWTLITPREKAPIVSIVLLLAIVNNRKNEAKNKMTRTQAWIRKTHSQICFKCNGALLS